MTTYNGEKFLAEQLDSIYNQTYKNIEVVVTDDCSTDGTVDILNEYNKKYGLKYFVNEENLGFVKNFEKAITLCCGDFIALSDQDDIWLPEKLEFLITEIGDNSLICSDAKLIDFEGEIFAESFRDFSKLEIVAEKNFNHFATKTFVTGCTCLFTKELLINALPFPNNLLLHDFWLGVVAKKTHGLKYIDMPLILYRQHQQNKLGAVDLRNEKNTLGIFIDKVIKLPDFFSSEREKIRIKFYLSLLNQTEVILYSNLSLLPEEKKYLECLKSYYLGLLNSNLQISSVFFLWKNKEYIFGENKKEIYFSLLRTIVVFLKGNSVNNKH